MLPATTPLTWTTGVPSGGDGALTGATDSSPATTGDGAGAAAAAGAATGAGRTGGGSENASWPRAAKNAVMRSSCSPAVSSRIIDLCSCCISDLDRVLGRRRVVLQLLRREDRPLVEQVRVELRVRRARVLGLHVKHAPAVSEIVVVPEDRAASGFVIAPYRVIISYLSSKLPERPLPADDARLESPAKTHVEDAARPR